MRAGQSTMGPLRTSALLATPLPDPAGESQCPVDFDAVYERHFDFVWRLARRLGVPLAAADDVVQDVFVVVHRRLADYDARVSIRSWLWGIVTRVVADHRRRYHRKDSRCLPAQVDADGTEPYAAPGPAPCELAEQAEALRLVSALLDELDPEKRELLILAQFEEMSAVEISDCLQLNINTVYTRLRAARRAFDAAYSRHRARRLRGEA